MSKLTLVCLVAACGCAAAPQDTRIGTPKRPAAAPPPEITVTFAVERKAPTLPRAEGPANKLDPNHAAAAGRNRLKPNEADLRDIASRLRRQ